jgi:hypothetical protein
VLRQLRREYSFPRNTTPASHPTLPLFPVLQSAVGAVHDIITIPILPWRAKLQRGIDSLASLRRLWPFLTLTSWLLPISKAQTPDYPKEANKSTQYLQNLQLGCDTSQDGYAATYGLAAGAVVGRLRDRSTSLALRMAKKVNRAQRKNPNATAALTEPQ